MITPEFDSYSASYEGLLKDPIGDGFAGDGFAGDGFAGDGFAGNGFAGNSLFFHLRKRALVRDYFTNSGVDAKHLRYFDVGCGKGKLLTLLAGRSSSAAGCDPSTGMLGAAPGVDDRVQQHPARIPFGDGQFDFITAVCVHHHVPPPLRAALRAEIKRLLKPGGVFAIIEHNPSDPATCLIVSRLPINANAILLRASDTRSLMRQAGLSINRPSYFLYFPEKLYAVARFLENLLRRLPLGDQYADSGQLA